ncbi:MAG: ester cyclase [Gemmatirosa sp.]|nr:ester cyclase [Gemmatirosa sp.]
MPHDIAPPSDARTGNGALLRTLLDAINANDMAPLAAHPGLAQTRERVPPSHRAFDDWRFTRFLQLVEDDVVFSASTLALTHVAPFAGVAPTIGRTRVEIDCCALDRVDDGIVVAHNATVDWPAAMRQLGAPGTAAWPRRAWHWPVSTPPAAVDASDVALGRATRRLRETLERGALPVATPRTPSDSLTAELATLRAACPDLAAEWGASVGQGDLVGVRTLLRGTHRAPLFGVEPTGRTLVWDHFGLARVADGAVVEYDGIFAWTRLFAQLGLMRV